VRPQKNTEVRATEKHGSEGHRRTQKNTEEHRSNLCLSVFICVYLCLSVFICGL